MQLTAQMERYVRILSSERHSAASAWESMALLGRPAAADGEDPQLSDRISLLYSQMNTLAVSMESVRRLETARVAQRVGVGVGRR